MEGPTPVFSQQNLPVPQKRKGNLGLLIIICCVVILVIAIAGVGFYFFKSAGQPPEKGLTYSQPEITEQLVESINEPSLSTSLSPTTSAGVAKSGLKFSVLNGSGKSGEAAFFKSKLLESGYEDITTGNYNTQDVNVTQVLVSPSVAENVAREITDLVKSFYQEVSVKTQSLTDTDVKIILGLRKGQSVTTSLSITSKLSPSVTPKLGTSITPTP